MIIKKYQGKTEEEATLLAKKELGENVVVLNGKEVKRKGLFYFFKAPIYEVTVALEEESEKPIQVKPYMGENQEIREKNDASNILFQSGKQEELEQENSKNAIEERLESLQNLIQSQMKPNHEIETKAMEDEIVEEESEQSVIKRLLYSTLIDNEVDEVYANQIMDEVEKLNKPNYPLDTILSTIYQKMILKFGNTVTISPAATGPKVVFFVGPTGVGKTTTIAKIASRLCVEDKKKVVLLTADTYRIAAAEQLRTYANILNIPFRVIYREEELTTAITDFMDSDYILVDTAGHSHKNQEQREEMYALVQAIQENIEKEIYLVLSATTKYKDLLQIADSYTSLYKYKLILTKLDETSSLGNLLNLRLHTNAPLSYVTYGQNVPDDIEVFHPQRTVKMLLGGKK